MEKPLEPQPVKEAYEKPELRKVRLASGEAAASGCKTTGGGAMGPTIGACASSMCMAIGS